MIIGKKKGAADAVEIPLADIAAVEPDNVVPHRFSLLIGKRRLALDVDTENSREILVRMVANLVYQYQTDQAERVNKQQVFKAAVGDTEAPTDCPICLSEACCPVQLECGHTYCAECLDNWRLQAEATPSCPECRAPLPPAASELLEKAWLFFDLRDEAPAKPPQRMAVRQAGEGAKARTARSAAKKSTRAMGLVRQAHELNPFARAGPQRQTALAMAVGRCLGTNAANGAENDVGAAAGVQQVEALLQREAKLGVSTLEEADDSGLTPLHLAVRSGGERCDSKAKLAMMQALLAMGADIHRPDAEQQSPLQVAISLGHERVKAALVAAGATVTKGGLAVALRRRRALARSSINIGRRPVWDLFGCYYNRSNSSGPAGLPASAITEPEPVVPASRRPALPSP